MYTVSLNYPWVTSKARQLRVRSVLRPGLWIFKTCNRTPRQASDAARKVHICMPWIFMSVKARETEGTLISTKVICAWKIIPKPNPRYHPAPPNPASAQPRLRHPSQTKIRSPVSTQKRSSLKLRNMYHLVSYPKWKFWVPYNPSC